MAAAANEPGAVVEGARAVDMPSQGRATRTGVLPEELGGWMGLRSSTRSYWALNNLVFMTILWIQFGLGIGVNLYVHVTRHHPGAGAGFFSGGFHSVVWAIAHSPVTLAIHAAVGIVVAVHSVHNLFWNVKWGTRGSAWAAGVNGAVFLNHNEDVNSLLMALFFAAAMLSYTMVVFLLAHSHEGSAASTAGRPMSASPAG